MINLSKWALKHRSFVIYLMVAAVVAGLVAYYRLGRNEDPAFIIKTMVVQAAWPGATLEDTVQQVTERLERQLQETPNLDYVRSYTSAGLTTIFVNLKQATRGSEVPDIWYHVRKSIGDIRRTICRPPTCCGAFSESPGTEATPLVKGPERHANCTPFPIRCQ
jgi:multidrug efflux pump